MRGGGPGRSRLWWWRFLFALVLTSGTTAGGLGGGYWYLGHKLDQAESVELELAAGPAANFLVLGSDSRAFVSDEEDRASFGSAAREAGQRADVILIVRVDPTTRQAFLVSIPRDTLMGPAGSLARPINGLFNGGPQAVVDGLAQSFAVPIHHYLELDFAGFRRMVDAVGGVSLSVPWPVRDRKTGLDLRQAGCNLLDGRAALAWVRSRGFSHLENGKWRTDPRGDLGRIERQQALLARLADQAVRRLALNPVRANQLADAVLANVRVDSGLRTGDVLRLARSLRSFGSPAVQMVSLPTVPVGPKVRPAPEAEAVLARLRGGPPVRESGPEPEPEPEPGKIAVRVLNGSGVAGEAGRASADLAKAGFRMLPAGDADRSGHARTTIRHAPSRRPAALVVAGYLNGTGALVADPRLAPGEVVVVVGADWRGVTAKPRPVTPAAKAAGRTPGRTEAPAPGATPTSAPAPDPAAADRSDSVGAAC